MKLYVEEHYSSEEIKKNNDKNRKKRYKVQTLLE
jgi:hypothetical protein